MICIVSKSLAIFVIRLGNSKAAVHVACRPSVLVHCKARNDWMNEHVQLLFFAKTPECMDHIL